MSNDKSTAVCPKDPKNLGKNIHTKKEGSDRGPPPSDKMKEGSKKVAYMAENVKDPPCDEARSREGGNVPPQENKASPPRLNRYNKFKKSVHGVLNKLNIKAGFRSDKDIERDIYDMNGNKVPWELSRSIINTLHYMKYREVMRRYTGQFRNCTYASCVIHMLMVICIIFASALISQHFDASDNGIVEKLPDNITILGLYFSDPNDVTTAIFIGALICTLNLYVCTHPSIYSKIIYLSKLTLRIFFISYPLLLLYNYHYNVSSGVDIPLDKIKAIFNIRAHAIFSYIHYDVLILTIYIFLF